LKSTSGKLAFVNGILFGFTFFAITIYWIQVFGYVAWFLLALVLSLWMGVFAAVTRWIIHNFGSTGQALMTPLLWSIVEYGRSLGPWGFGWANLGSTVDNAFIASIASFVGETGLSYVIVLVNVLLFILSYDLYKEIIAEKNTRSNVNISKNIPRISMIAVSMLVLLLFSVSASVSASFSKSRTPESISVSLIQPNIPQYVKINSANNDTVKKTYKEMTLKALACPDKDVPDMIIWPESVIVEYANNDQEFYNGIADVITDKGASFLYGALSYNGADNIYNNAVFVGPSGKPQTYQKIHLVPFGEYVPARKLVESVNNMAGLVADKTAGSNYRVFNIRREYERKYKQDKDCLLYTSPSPRDRTRSRMPSSA
jgi:apolipoprotein N-acyltransferase